MLLPLLLHGTRGAVACPCRAKILKPFTLNLSLLPPPGRMHARMQGFPDSHVFFGCDLGTARCPTGGVPTRYRQVGGA